MHICIYEQDKWCLKEGLRAQQLFIAMEIHLTIELKSMHPEIKCILGPVMNYDLKQLYSTYHSLITENI